MLESLGPSQVLPLMPLGSGWGEKYVPWEGAPGAEMVSGYDAPGETQQSPEAPGSWVPVLQTHYQDPSLGDALLGSLGVRVQSSQDRGWQRPGGVWSMVCPARAALWGDVVPESSLQSWPHG